MRSVVQCLGVAELIDNRLALLVEDKGFKELMLESEHLAEWEHQPHRARGTFYGNWAHMIIGALAWNLKIWLELLLHHIDAQRAETIIRMEYRTFINLIIRIPTQVLFQARRLVLRLLRVNKWTDLLINAPPILHRLKLA